MFQSINESNFKEKMEQVIGVKFGTYKQNWDFLGPFQDFGPSWDQDPNLGPLLALTFISAPEYQIFRQTLLKKNVVFGNINVW